MLCSYASSKPGSYLAHHGGEDMEWTFVFQNTELVTHVCLEQMV